MPIISHMGVDYDSPNVQIQDNASATDLDNTKVPTGQTIESYINNNFILITPSKSITAPNGTSSDMTYTLSSSYSGYTIVSVTMFFMSKVIKPYIINIDANVITFYTENTYGSSLTRDMYLRILLKKS